MLALAHRIERQIASDELADCVEAGRRIGLTPRVKQLCDLVRSHETQEELLALESIDGVEPITERALRPIAAEPSRWDRQREMWRAQAAFLRGPAPRAGSPEA